MARLAISTDFLASFAKLEKRQQQKVATLADQFQRMSVQDLRDSKGIHLERHVGARDDRARTIRIDNNHRGIVIDAGDDETYILTTIGTHDDTDRWVANNTFRVNEATGALEIRDVVAIEETAERVIAESSGATPLFEHRRDRDFTNLGIDADLVPTLRAFTAEDQLLGLLLVLPQGQGDALMGLLGDEDVEVIYRDVAGAVDRESIDTGDLVAALEAPASQKQFQVFTNETEIAEMLAQPLSQWRVYLHHTQRELAERPVYNGPARVTGGAGTGKTVVALHRARYLASQLEDRDRTPILFTTFTRNLARIIEADLRSLGGAETLDVVEVMNVDALAHRIVRDAEGTAPGVIADPQEIQDLWQRAIDETGGTHSPAFMQGEWEQVILARRCESRADYFQVSRAGRGVPLDRRGRAEVWKAVEAFRRHLDETGRRTYLQIADAAAGYLVARTVKPYRHIVVDEAQDLHEAQWRLLRAAVDEAPNDLFIVGDSHQRIYDRRSSLSKVGINIVGRSRKLRINYRTTHQILRWAMRLLGEDGFDDLDDGLDEQNASGYYSYLSGDEPVHVAAVTKKQQLDALAEQVTAWIDGGLAEHEIGVAARTNTSLQQARDALRAAGVEALIMGPEIPTGDGVRLGTMHRMKGLEFRAVAVIDVDDRTVPFPIDITPSAEDEVQHRVDLRRECCLLYVACTRAREHLWVGWNGKPSRFLGPVIED